MINKKQILNVLNEAKQASDQEIQAVIDCIAYDTVLSMEQVGILLQVTKPEHFKQMTDKAKIIKERIYGHRIVMFAPLYVSDYCVNECSYCGYSYKNQFARKKLTKKEIEQEVMILESMGHKRLALELGEDPRNCGIDTICDMIDTIYNTRNDHGVIRRLNINIAATTVEDYKRLHEKGIGTYILFQETYDEDAYKAHHIKGPKSNYNYHLTAFDRAMEAGIEDVGAGVLFGLADYQFEVLALMQHNAHLEERFNVGFHTISVPRLKAAHGMNLEDYPHIMNDFEFKKMVTILRLAFPFVGLILSTRENETLRKELLEYGVSQVSAGSSTSVGGYKEREDGNYAPSQFETSDERSPLEVVKWLVSEGYIPSFCTACYRSNRVGDRFMELAKSGEIGFICEPNALLTFLEFVDDYGDQELKTMSIPFLEKYLEGIENPIIYKQTVRKIEALKNGERDQYL